MKVEEIVQEDFYFKPLVLEITLTSQDEVYMLYNIMNNEAIKKASLPELDVNPIVEAIENSGYDYYSKSMYTRFRTSLMNRFNF